MKLFLQIVILNLPLLAFGQVKSADGDNAYKPATIKLTDVQVGSQSELSLEPKQTSGFNRYKPVEMKASDGRKPRVRESEEELLKQKANGPGPKDRYQPVK